ncbi:MAG: hypothetical protein Q4B39_01810 [[Ruminococcus] gnavus]|nr:hypothetical protein [Mediterraneibacter gnavus]
MAACVLFMIFCSLISVAAGAIAVFVIFAIRRAIRNKKQEKELQSSEE